MRTELTLKSGLFRCVRDALAASQLDQALSPSFEHAVDQTLAVEMTSAFDRGSRDDQLDLQRAAYLIICSRLAVPWQAPSSNADHPLFTRILYGFERGWRKQAMKRHRDVLGRLPSIEEFPDWMVGVVQSHASNVGHPLFSFLKHNAGYTQLREFLYQETPFDILFGDILALMLPGIYDAPKREMLSNFWDEMGRGNLALMHRNLRLDMMAALDMLPESHIAELENFCVEELALANHYLLTAVHRSRLAELIGALLATETMVPGRLQCQIDGWRRVGLADESMTYLLEHTVVDIGHADGWMNGVVKPVLAAAPEVLPDIVLGVLRRLELAGDICDVMHRSFSAEEVQEPAAVALH
jgi:pyrroloquinoline quinone (PQQ) biosynthesis protein C